MANVYYDRDAKIEVLRGKTVAVLGYGSQGHAHSQNLRDSGISVVVGLYEGGRSAAVARSDGFEVLSVADAVRRADVVMVLLPDTAQPSVYRESIAPNLRSGMALAFAHGFAIHYHQIEPPTGVDVFMVAPKSPGHIVRRLYSQGKGTPGLLAIHNDATGRAKEIGMAYASAIGCGRAGVIETTFQEETETDLFGEQAVLCGGVTELMKAGFQTLVEAGYQPEIAYFECLNEMKLIVDLIYEGGFSWMRYSISDTAEYGDMVAGPRVIGDESRKTMKKLLTEIQDGTFAKDWILENQTGRPKMKAWRGREASQQLEEVGARLRDMMPWLESKKVPER